MSSADLAPVNSEFVSELVGSLCLGDESNLLSKVKVNVVLVIHTLNFDQTNTVVLGSECALVTKDGSINVKAWGSGGHDKDLLKLKSIENKTGKYTRQNLWMLRLLQAYA
jgi:hypothetical protein